MARSGYVHAFETKLPNLTLKTSRFSPLDIVLPGLTSAEGQRPECFK